jgi:hypothetical protein
MMEFDKGITAFEWLDGNPVYFLTTADGSDTTYVIISSWATIVGDVFRFFFPLCLCTIPSAAFFLLFKSDPTRIHWFLRLPIFPVAVAFPIAQSMLSLNILAAAKASIEAEVYR